MSLKIALLTNYPQVDKVLWKKKFVEKTLQNGHTVDVFYGKKDIVSLGLNYFKKIKYSSGVIAKAKSKETKNILYFKNKRVTVYRFKNLNSSKAISKIEENHYDIIVTALDQILSGNFIKKINAPIVNTHYGLLPDVKGTSALEWTFFEHKKCVATLHYINAGIDTGAIISKTEIPVKVPVHFSTLRNQVQEVIPHILEDFLAKTARQEKITVIENKGGKLYTFMHPEFVAIIEKER